ncbi:MAG: ABC transporter substrate-binding protein [Chloroflexi bacterium]|nr:ABC transporter substrate-binding protein [Chloroflexota bacterium]
MRREWVNGAMALALSLSVFLAACEKPAPTVKPTQTPPPAARATSPPAAKPTTKPSPAPTSKPPPPAAANPATEPLSKAAPAPKPNTVTVLVANFGNEGFLPQNDSMTAFKLLPMYEALWEDDPDTRELRPMLAETLPQWSEDNKTLYITLRQGVQFHDGWGELTAEDVKFSMELVGPRDSVNAAKSDFAKAQVDTLGPYKLAVNLPAPDWAWAMKNLSTGRFVVPIVSKKYTESRGEAEAGRRPVGTGPFKFVKHEVGRTLEFEAVPNHWRVTPDYKTLVMKVVTEPATVLAMLRTGEADIATVPVSFVPEARAAGLDVRLIRNVGTIGVGLGGQYLASRDTFDPNVPWVLAKEPEKALKVRKALNLAVNRQEIIDKVLNGIGGPWPILASPNVDASYDPSWKPYPYDPEQAKRLLAEAGFPNGFETTMVQFTATGHASVEIAEAVAIYWEKIGIRVKRLPMDQPAHRTRQVGRKNAGVAFPVWRSFYNEEAVNVDRHFTSRGTALNTLFEYPEIDGLLGKAVSEMNTERRMAMTKEFHKLMYDGYLAVPVSLEHMAIGAGKKIGEWQVLTADPFLYRSEFIKLK